jgi:hypothetical protein
MHAAAMASPARALRKAEFMIFVPPELQQLKRTLDYPVS